MLVKCKHCRGKGYVFVNKKVPRIICGVCNGTGSLDVPDGKKICPKCKGGKIRYIPTRKGGCRLKCGRCNGTGFVRLS